LWNNKKLGATTWNEGAKGNDKRSMRASAHDEVLTQLIKFEQTTRVYAKNLENVAPFYPQVPHQQASGNPATLLKLTRHKL